MSLRFLGQDIGRRLKILNAGVSELADETDSKSVIRKGVWVRVPPPAPTNIDKKDIMPTNGLGKPFVGINLMKNRFRSPQIFSTRKWT